MNQNLSAPGLQAPLPNYPIHEQNIRLIGPADGNNIYPGFVQQYGGNLAFRDREKCYLFEPNGVALSLAIYDCRLVGSYLGSPLFSTTCCTVGTIPSSSVSGSLSTTPLRIPLGGYSSGGLLTDGLLVPNLPFMNGLVEVIVATVGGNALSSVQVSLGELLLAKATSVTLPGGIAGSVQTFYAPVSTLTDNLHIDVGSGKTVILVSVANVLNLAGNVLDQLSVNSGSASAPSSGATPTTLSANEFAQGSALMAAPVGTWSAANGFTLGGQDVSVTFDGVVFWLVDLYRILNAMTSVNAALSGVTAASWSCSVGTFD